MPRYSTGLLSQFAPQITELTECNLPSIDDKKNLCNNLIHPFVLNSAFKAKYPEPTHQYALVFLVKTETALKVYFNAKNTLSRYISTQILHSDNPNQKISQYFETLHSFEILISLMYQAYEVFEKFLDLKKEERFWKKGDGSALEKLNTIYNFWRHAEDKINQNPTLLGYLIWVNNDGVSCEEATISFLEIHELLLELLENATYYSDVEKVIQDYQKLGTLTSQNSAD